MKASELKNKGIKFKLSDKEYELKFDSKTNCVHNLFKSPGVFCEGRMTELAMIEALEGLNW